MPSRTPARTARRLAAATLLAGSLLALSACASGASPATTTTTARAHAAHGEPAGHWRHVFVVVMENLSYGSALAVPGYAALAHEYASASDFYSTAHPSLPNYLALTSGSTHGVTSDCLTCFLRSDNLAAQLAARHVTWGDFSQGAPRACYLGTSFGEYAAKHNPFRYYLDVRDSRAMCHHLQPLTTLDRELLEKASAVPAFSFVTPNICNDGHDCSASVASAWLTGFLKAVTASKAYADRGLVMVTWDEAADSDTSSITPSGQVHPSGGGGHVLTLLCAPGVPKGTVVSAPLDHYALLATIERNFGLSYLGQASAWSAHTLSLP